MPDLLTSLVAGAIAVALASILPSLLGKWLAKRRWKVSLKIGPTKVSVDLSDPDSIPATLAAHTESPQVFLAYSHKDKDFVDKLVEDLRHRGLRVWYDVEQIRPGDRIVEKLRDGLSTSGYMLAILSRASVVSPWATKEIEMAMSRELEGKWPRVIPVLVGDVELPAFLSQKMYVDLRENYEDGLAQVANTIRSLDTPSAVQASAAN